MLELPADRTQPLSGGTKDNQASTISNQTPIVRPSLEYQHAFDFCAMEARREGGPVCIAAGNAFYARELLKRMNDVETYLIPLGNWYRLQDQPEQLGPEIELSPSMILTGLDVRPRVIVWAEPGRGSVQRTLRQIEELLPSDGRLYILASGWLSVFQRELGKSNLNESPARLTQIRKWLRNSTLNVEALYGFHGLASIFWGHAYHLMESAGRNDLADRSHFKMRAKYVAKGWRASWAPVTVMQARSSSRTDH